MVALIAEPGRDREERGLPVCPTCNACGANAVQVEFRQVRSAAGGNPEMFLVLFFLWGLLRNWLKQAFSMALEGTREQRGI